RCGVRRRVFDCAAVTSFNRRPSCIVRVSRRSGVGNRGNGQGGQRDEIAQLAIDDQHAPYCRGDRREIGHDITSRSTASCLSVSLLSGAANLPEIQPVPYPPVCYRITGPLAFFQASIPPSI